MYNFFINNNQIEKGKAKIIGSDFNHIKNVLRLKKDEKIIICNKETSESYYAKIKTMERDFIICNLIEKKETTELPINITIYQGIPKSDKMELIIQKSVELGVNKIIPTEMKFCIAKIKDEDKKISRWQSISEAAAKQSKRTIIPKIERVKSFEKMCQEIKDFDLAVLAYENEENISFKDIIKENNKIKNIALIIGPEGGISQEEANKLVELGVKKALLGKRILRTETAAITMLSMLIYEFEL